MPDETNKENKEDNKAEENMEQENNEEASPSKLKKHDNTTKLDEAEFMEAAERMGIAAIKYFDMKPNRTQNYKFDFDKMLNPKGDTAVY